MTANRFLSRISVCLFMALFLSSAWLAVAQSSQSDEERDFLPGEKTIFYDDFSDMAKGAAPPHWKVRGGAVKLGPDGRLLLRGGGALYPNLKALPKNFTIETEISAQSETDSGSLNWTFKDATAESVWSVYFSFFPNAAMEVTLTVGEGHSDYEGHPKGSAKFEFNKPIRLAVWFQDARLRAYVNNERVLDLNQLEFKPPAVALLEYGLDERYQVFLSSNRIAESSPDISRTLFATGRYVSHAIQFDVNSDRLRPESLNIIKEVAGALRQQAAMKVRIEGHTDSTGDPAKNLDLSRRRAESVRQALVKLGIDAQRLTTDGLGQTKPLSPNDTAQGRAENRRVEFVKI